jgi:Uma2 family endonuclease
MTGTKVLGPCTPALEASLAERRRLGQDRLDEVWQGEYHMNPGPHPRHGRAAASFLVAVDPLLDRLGVRSGVESNIGRSDDYRVGDIVLTRGEPDELYLLTAAIVVEVLSPGDESRQKFDHYAAHAVDEFVIIDPSTKDVEWYELADGAYRPTVHSGVLGVDVATVVDAMRW